MKTKNNYIIIQKKKLQSESGIVRGQPKNIGVVIEKNSQTEVGDLIVYKSSFIFTFNGEEFEAVSPHDIVAVVGEEE